MRNRNRQVTLANYRDCVAAQAAFLTGTEPKPEAPTTEQVRWHYENGVSVDAAATDCVERGMA